MLERSYTSTSQPIRRRKAAENNPDIEPPIMTARRLARRDEEEPGMPGDPNANTSEIPTRASVANRPKETSDFGPRLKTGGGLSTGPWPGIRFAFSASTPGSAEPAGASLKPMAI